MIGCRRLLMAHLFDLAQAILKIGFVCFLFGATDTFTSHRSKKGKRSTTPLEITSP